MGRRAPAGGFCVLPGLPARPRLGGRRRDPGRPAGPRHRAPLHHHGRPRPDRRDARPPVASTAAGLDRRVRRDADPLGGRTGRGRSHSAQRKRVGRPAPDPTRHACQPPVRGVRSDGLPFIYVREATLGTGLYLHATEAEPGAAVQAVFDVLGLDRRDVASELPPSIVAERIAAYRAVNPGQDGLRVLAYNAGSGELLARAWASRCCASPSAVRTSLLPRPGWSSWRTAAGRPAPTPCLRWRICSRRWPRSRCAAPVRI